MQGLLRRDDVRGELDLTDEQLEELESIQGFGFDRERMREMREEMEGLSERISRAEIPSSANVKR